MGHGSSNELYNFLTYTMDTYGLRGYSWINIIHTVDVMLLVIGSTGSREHRNRRFARDHEPRVRLG